MDPKRNSFSIARPIGPILSGLLLLMPLAAGASEVRTTVSVGEDLKLDALTTDAGELGLVRVDDTVELELEDAIVLTLERNLSVVVERFRRSQTIQNIEEAQGIFDLNLSSTLRVDEDTSPSTSVLEETDGSVTNEGMSLNVRLDQLTSIGGTATLSVNDSRFETSDLNFTPNPRFNVDFDLAYSQPLLRNFGRDVTLNGIRVARNSSAISRETFRAQVEIIVQQVSDEYWLLVEALEQLRVTEESLALAEELHNMNRIQVEVGTMAPLEMVQSEAGVATRQEQIISGQAAVADAADNLRRFLNLDEERYWDLEIVPVSEPITEYVEIDIHKAYEVALEKRSDVRTQILTNANRDLQLAFARNQAKPSLDVTAGYNINGVDGRNSDGFQQILDRDSDGWSVQAVFGYPLQNRTAKARQAQAQLDLEQGAVEMLDLEQQVLLNVRQLARRVRTAEQQIESAKVSTKLQRKNLEAEQKRYENGLATSFEVLQIQEDLTEAQSREVSAITAYRRALNAFYSSTGEILEKAGVALAEEGSVDP